jgi:hypothetical protein
MAKEELALCVIDAREVATVELNRQRVHNARNGAPIDRFAQFAAGVER